METFSRKTIFLIRPLLMWSVSLLIHSLELGYYIMQEFFKYLIILYKNVVPVLIILYRFYRKIHYLTREFHVKFHAKNRYRTNRFAIRAISVFRVKFNVEFTSQVIDFP